MELTQDLQKLLADWYDASAKVASIAKPLVERERVLRAMVARELFPSPVEGSKNKLEIQDGWGIQLTHKLERKVLEPQLELSREELEKARVNVDAIIRRPPELNVKAYRELSEEQRLLVDRLILEIKPSSPQLEVVKPKGT